MKTNAKIHHKLGNIKLGIIGFGNVGQNIFYALDKIGSTPTWVLTTKAVAFLSTEVYSDITEITQSVDVVLICVKDDAVESVSKKLPTFLKEKAIVAHTSGVLSWDKMDEGIEHRATFYPVQTISKERELDWKKMPLVIGAETETAKSKLEELAKKLGGETYELNDSQKKQLHLAAVFANNFVNHFWEISKSLCEQEKIPSEILTAIRKETLAKFLDPKIVNSQTGPALRGDSQTMESHRELLNKDSALESIYKQVSNHITAYNYGKEL